MKTIFSHVIQKQLSHRNEDVATEALTFLVEESATARMALLKVLRGVIPSLPDLVFRSQVQDGQVRPDMWGFHNGSPHVFIENKFWAGLTDNQPVAYLKLLSMQEHDTGLVFITPQARVETIWREVLRRIKDAGMSLLVTEDAVSKSFIAKTHLGPAMAVILWSRILSELEISLVDEHTRKNDVLQLRALCEAADLEAFLPLSGEDITNQR